MEFSGATEAITIVVALSEVVGEDDTIEEEWLRLYFEVYFRIFIFIF